jgi:hypothetical protein
VLKIKKSHKDKEEYIVFNPHNFDLHTHVYSLRVAKKIKYIVEHQLVPTSANKQFVISCIRLTADKQYKEQLTNYLTL